VDDVDTLVRILQSISDHTAGMPVGLPRKRRSWPLEEGEHPREVGWPRRRADRQHTGVDPPVKQILQNLGSILGIGLAVWGQEVLLISSPLVTSTRASAVWVALIVLVPCVIVSLIRCRGPMTCDELIYPLDRV